VKILILLALPLLSVTATVRASDGPPADSPQATYEKGLALLKGSDSGMYEDGFLMVKSAAHTELPEAMASLGYLFAEGKGVQPSDKMATHWLTKAADAGVAKAQFNLAKLMLAGRVEGDKAIAVELLRKASDQKMPEAASVLGEMYYFGDAPVTRDYDKAYPLLLVAAENGNLSAQNTVGVMLRNGFGVEKDPVAATKWFLASAQAGHAKAMGNLATAYVNAEGVERDRVEALKWIYIGDSLDEVTCTNVLASHRSLVDDAGNADARKRAAEFLGKLGKPLKPEETP
jgi:uncharacterized protein